MTRQPDESSHETSPVAGSVAVAPDRVALTEQVVAAMPFAALLGIEFREIAADSVEGSLRWTPSFCTGGGVLHGGAIMGLADTLGGICAFTNLPAASHTSTIESKTNLIRPVRSGTIVGRAVPVHVGRTTIVVQTTVSDDGGRLVAITLQTQAVTPG